MAEITKANGINVGIRKFHIIKELIRYKYLYLLLLPGIVMLVVFRYIPIYGIVMAFQKYKPIDGFFGSKWVGLKHFISFFSNPYSFTLIKNTLLLGLYTLIFSFPFPIIIALAFNEIRNYNIKKVGQTISYLPYFVSTVIIVGITKELLSLDTGIINRVIMMLGGEQIMFFQEPEWFRFIYIFTHIWQSAGFGSIIYLAALSSISIELYESSKIDGANRFQDLYHITLPSIMPTVAVMLILAVGGILGNDFTKIILIYNGATYETADVLQTYVYRTGIQGANFGFAAAVGLFNSVVSFIFLYAANTITRKLEGNSLW